MAPVQHAVPPWQREPPGGHATRPAVQVAGDHGLGRAWPVLHRHLGDGHRTGELIPRCRCRLVPAGGGVHRRVARRAAV